MKARLPFASALLLALALPLACAKREAPPAAESAIAAEESRAAPAVAGVAGAAPAARGAQASPVPRPARKLIRSYDLSLEVRRPEEASAALQKLAERLGGYVDGLSAQRMDDGTMRVELTLRIPAERLDAARTEAKKLAVRVVREQLQTEDVTDQLVDLGARLKTLQATEGELRALLAESRAKARKVDEIMAVYQQLTEIRTQIEQIGAQVAGLDRQVAYSKLHVELWPVASARPVAGEGWQPGDTARTAARTLLQILRALGDFAIYAAMVLLPVGALLWLVWRLLRGAVRRLRRPRV
ncbi:MAG TPA: DUF4349 domain-containing protein [Thermoanaerobaculia bacterium]|nr:DUF4349 domain-containing protein [Thermoanaerobaculia bacterium]